MTLAASPNLPGFSIAAPFPFPHLRRLKILRPLIQERGAGWILQNIFLCDLRLEKPAFVAEVTIKDLPAQDRDAQE
jgi:hypothetical protein